MSVLLEHFGLRRSPSGPPFVADPSSRTEPRELGKTGPPERASAVAAPGYPDPETRKRILAGIRRPDRPSWDRATPDPFRNTGPEPAPFGPDLLPVISDPHGAVTEWFRMVRLALEEWIEGRGDEAQSVLVTSAEPEAGKTFVAVNLALLFANEPASRVLLVDGDMRRPRFESLFGTPARPGLADVLAGRSRLEHSVQYISEVGLYVLPAGRAGSPRNLVRCERLEPILEQMKIDVDLVIIDAPPMATWVDARSMAAAADGVLFVVRAGRTRAQELTCSLRSVDRASLIGAVVTDVETESRRGYRRPRR